MFGLLKCPHLEVARSHVAQGFVTSTSSRSKSRTLRVATDKSWALAVPAISASTKSKTRPERCACARNWAAHCAAILSRGRMRSSYSVMSPASVARNSSRRRPAGRSCKPNSSSCNTSADSHSSCCPDKNAVTRVSGRSFVSSQAALASRTKLTEVFRSPCVRVNVRFSRGALFFLRLRTRGRTGRRVPTGRGLS